MSDLERGDRVISTKDIGGVMRPYVSKGTEGVVLNPGGFWSGQLRVSFNGEDVDCEADEIAKIGKG